METRSMLKKGMMAMIAVKPEAENRARYELICLYRVVFKPGFEIRGKTRVTLLATISNEKYHQLDREKPDWLVHLCASENPDMI